MDRVRSVTRTWSPWMIWLLTYTTRSMCGLLTLVDLSVTISPVSAIQVWCDFWQFLYRPIFEYLIFILRKPDLLLSARHSMSVDLYFTRGSFFLSFFLSTFLGRLHNHNLTAIFTAYTFGMEYDIDNRSSALTTTWGLLYRPEMSWTLVHKRLQTRPAFYPPSLNSAFCFIARLRRRSSANGTQPNFAN